MAALSADVRIRNGKAAEPRSILAKLDRARRALLHTTPAYGNRLVRLSVAILVSACLDLPRARNRNRHAISHVRATADETGGGVLRHCSADADLPHGQLHLFQSVDRRALSVAVGRSVSQPKTPSR